MARHRRIPSSPLLLSDTTTIHRFSSTLSRTNSLPFQRTFRMVRCRELINPKLLHPPCRLPYQPLLWLWLRRPRTAGSCRSCRRRRCPRRCPRRRGRRRLCRWISSDRCQRRHCRRRSWPVAVSIISGGGFLANERRIVICLDRLSLSFKESLQARIASGTDNRGNRSK